MPKRERALGTIQIVILSLVSDRKGSSTCGEVLQPLVQEIVEHPVSTAQVYTALRRLVARGLLRVKQVSLKHTRGKPRNVHVLTTAGKESYELYCNIARKIVKEA